MSSNPFFVVKYLILWDKLPMCNIKLISLILLKLPDLRKIYQMWPKSRIFNMIYVNWIQFSLTEDLYLERCRLKAWTKPDFVKCHQESRNPRTRKYLLIICHCNFFHFTMNRILSSTKVPKEGTDRKWPLYTVDKHFISINIINIKTVYAKKFKCLQLST